MLWLLGIDQNHKKLAVPVLRLLETVLAHDGDLQGEDNIRLKVVFKRESLPQKVMSRKKRQSLWLLLNYVCIVPLYSRIGSLIFSE